MKRTPASASPLPVSVIVCAHDEEENLKELIPALLSQDHFEFEVIIVDDRSNDNTFDLLLAETSKDHRLRMVHVNRTPAHADSKKWALTLGIRAARYEWILLTDADCRPAGNRWISTMSSSFGSGIDFVLGYSPYTPARGLLNAFIRFETLLTGMQFLSFAIFGLPYMGVGRNMAYRRSRFLAVKGFNAVLGVTGGDDDLLVNKHARRSNTTVCTSVSAQTLSIPKTRWRSFFYQKVRHLAVGRKYRLHHRLLLGMFATSWLGAWFLGISLAVFADHTDVWIGLLLLRIIVVMVTVNRVAKKLGQPFPNWIVPLLDFIYAFYYLVTGLRALVTQKVRWKS
jgi:glycosyltransferase involved in cell wall biosynthesis